MTLQRIYEKNEAPTSSAPIVSLHLVLARAEPSPRSQEGVITFIPSPLKMISSSETGKKKGASSSPPDAELLLFEENILHSKPHWLITTP